MNDRRPTILIIIQLATFLSLVATVVLVAVQHAQRSAQIADILRELRDARQARYEYKVVTIASEGHDRRGERALETDFAALAQPAYQGAA